MRTSFASVAYIIYDAAGNRTQAIIDTATTISYTYNTDGSLAYEISNNGSTSETTTYSYDLNGNLITKSVGVSTTTYTYNVWGNMTSGAGATYSYNAQGLRTSKTANSETDNFVLIAGNVWSDGEAEYFRGIELISNGTQLYLYNIRGDVIQLVGFDGTVAKTYDYDAYGNELQRDLNDENPFRYCGEYYDTETGFIYLRARYYDPLTGRFAAMDTHWNPSNAIYGDNPVKTIDSDECNTYFPNGNAIKQSSNLYAYCMDNPVRYVDFTGELAWPGEIHDAVVKHLYWSSPGEYFREQIILFDNHRVGRADLISIDGQIWDVKRDKTSQIARGIEQVQRYVDGKWVGKPAFVKSTSVGGFILSGYFIYHTAFVDYFVTYRYAGGGVIAYDYSADLNEEEIAATVLALGAIAVAVFVIYASGGALAPVLIPI